MTASAPRSEAATAPVERTARRLRRGLLGLAALTIGGLTVELAAERHWRQPSQLIAWVALALAAAALGLLIGRPAAPRIRLARSLAALVIISALIGVWQHIAGNYEAGPLDGRYTATWESLPVLERWWLAASKGVGPAPPLAAGALAQLGLSLLLASMRLIPPESRPSARPGRD